MSGMMSGMMSKAYGVGNQAGSMWDQMTGAKASPGAQTPAQGQPGQPQDVTMPKKVMGAPAMSPYASQGMGGYTDMSQPQGQDFMSLIGMLQGGQMQRGRR
jgi:hypothetical protein